MSTDANLCSCRVVCFFVNWCLMIIRVFWRFFLLSAGDICFFGVAALKHEGCCTQAMVYFVKKKKTMVLMLYSSKKAAAPFK
ncbi:hypothetical protein LINPERHAP1_LOCUS18172, partial [Linum perenne]